MTKLKHLLPLLGIAVVGGNLSVLGMERTIIVDDSKNKTKKTVILKDVDENIAKEKLSKAFEKLKKIRTMYQEKRKKEGKATITYDTPITHFLYDPKGSEDTGWKGTYLKLNYGSFGSICENSLFCNSLLTSAKTGALAMLKIMNGKARSAKNLDAIFDMLNFLVVASAVLYPDALKFENLGFKVKPKFKNEGENVKFLDLFSYFFASYANAAKILKNKKEDISNLFKKSTVDPAWFSIHFSFDGSGLRLLFLGLDDFKSIGIHYDEKKDNVVTLRFHEKKQGIPENWNEEYALVLDTDSLIDVISLLYA